MALGSQQTQPDLVGRPDRATMSPIARTHIVCLARDGGRARACRLSAGRSAAVLGASRTAVAGARTGSTRRKQADARMAGRTIETCCDVAQRRSQWRCAVARGRAARRLRLVQRRGQALNPDPPDENVCRRRRAAWPRASSTDAAKKFEDLDRDHPYSPEARRAIVHGGLRLLQGRQVTRRRSPRRSATRPCIPAPRTRRSPITSSPRPTSTRSRIRRATRPPRARR